MSPRVDYSINCWDTTWLGVVTELTVIRNTLRKEDTLGLLLHEHFWKHPEVMDSIREIEKLPDLDWLTLEPKKAHRKKCQNKQWVNKRAYDDMLYNVNTRLKPAKDPEIKPINQITTIKPAQDDNTSTDDVWMGDTLTATMVHLNTVVPTQDPDNIHQYGIADIVELPKLSRLPIPT